MHIARPGFQGFLHRVHVRHVTRCVVESAGLGLLAGCAAGLPLLGIAAYRGLPGLQIAWGVTALGLGAGGLWGWLRRPSALQSALEADRQLGWSDLLSTASTIRPQSAQDPWALVIRQEADERCARIPASRIVLGRLGARAWGGIGLAAALVGVVGLFPTFAASTRAGDERPSSANPLAEFAPVDRHAGASTPFARRTAQQQDPDDPNASRFDGPDDSANRSVNSKLSDPSDPHRSGDLADPNGRGSGLSESNLPVGSEPLSPVAATNAARRAPGGTPAGGAGKSSFQPEGGSGSGHGAVAGSQASSPAAPPWELSTWQQDVDRAAKAVQSGQVPDAYRDLVRGYFDRTDARHSDKAGGPDAR